MLETTKVSPIIVICVTVCQPSEVSLTDANPRIAEEDAEASAYSSEMGEIKPMSPCILKSRPDDGKVWTQAEHHFNLIPHHHHHAVYLQNSLTLHE